MAFDRKILSIDSDDDDKDYEAFSEFLEEETNRNKNSTASEIEKLGEHCLSEIDRKNKNKKLKATKLISYILKHCDGKYDKEELLSYSFGDVEQIYNEIKTKNRPAIAKFFHFLFDNFDYD